MDDFKTRVRERTIECLYANNYRWYYTLMAYCMYAGYFGLLGLIGSIIEKDITSFLIGFSIGSCLGIFVAIMAYIKHSSIPVDQEYMPI